MKFRLLLTGIAIGVVPMLLLGPVAAQEGEGGGMMMQPAWAKLTKEHADYKKVVGDWNYTMKMWMAPGAPPMQASGTAGGKLLWQGNYMEQTIEGTFGPQKWEGRLTLGYDTIDKKHVAVWIDSMSPVPSISYGTEKDGVITYEGTEADHFSPAPGGAKIKTKMDVSWTDNDHYSVVFFKAKADGSWQKSGEIAYTRKGAEAAAGCGCGEKAAEGCGCGEKAGE